MSQPSSRCHHGMRPTRPNLIRMTATAAARTAHQSRERRMPLQEPASYRPVFRRSRPLSPKPAVGPAPAPSQQDDSWKNDNEAESPLSSDPEPPRHPGA